MSFRGRIWRRRSCTLTRRSIGGLARSLRRRLSSGARRRTFLANLALAQAPGATSNAALVRIRPPCINLARPFAGRAIDYAPIAIAGAGATTWLSAAAVAWAPARAGGAGTRRRMSVVWAHCASSWRLSERVGISGFWLSLRQDGLEVVQATLELQSNLPVRVYGSLVVLAIGEEWRCR